MLELSRTTDILGTVQGNFLKIGFAAESRDLVFHAREKLEQKDLDLIIANDITAPGSGFNVDTNQVTLLHRFGQSEALPLMTKEALAHIILDRVKALWP